MVKPFAPRKMGGGWKIGGRSVAKKERDGVCPQCWHKMSPQVRIRKILIEGPYTWGGLTAWEAAPYPEYGSEKQEIRKKNHRLGKG